MNRTETMAYLEGFSHTGAPIKDLSRIRLLLQSVGNPQEKLRFVHIAGTNGKGSTLTDLSQILMAAGYRTGQFTSPYIHRYTDRIRINDREIPEEALCRLCERVRACAPDAPFSQFEITEAIALLYYAEEGCNIVCLETGIGGLLDATNVVTPEVCVLTSISMDHMAILGDTIEQIAAQKAGIIKEGRPVVLSADNPEAVFRVVAAQAARQHAPLLRPDRAACEVTAQSILGSRFVFHGTPYRIPMPGEHQIQNALTALTAAQLLRERGFAISTQAEQTGLACARLDARITVRSESPFVIVDGGHNADGIAVLAKTLRAFAPRPVCAVIGMLTTKDYRMAARILSECVDRVICVDDFAPNAVPATELASLFACPSAQMPLCAAYEAACWEAQKTGGTALVCGSLYLAAALPEGCCGIC